ncbi:MAG: tetratricopeptide repeat protein, partial [Thermoanaerobaculia bacterium]
PLPPPVTRGFYRANWFEFLNALLEDDDATANQSLTRLRRGAQAVGVRYLSDFSRTAVYQGRRAERQGQLARAARAYDAAIALDATSFDAVASKIGFLVRQRQFGEALALLPEAGGALIRTREARFALLSSLLLWLAFAVCAAALATVVILLVRSWPRLGHDFGEWAGRRFGPGAGLPATLLALGVPLAAGLGPWWLLLWWAVILFPYASRPERTIVSVGLLVMAIVPPLLTAIGRENIIRRSPLYVAAVDLEEQREDGAAEDGLRQASSVFDEDPDVWFLLGMYAQRAGDTQRAIGFYDRAIEAGPKDYRAFVNRGNVHFEEGDYGEAIRDYLAAVERNPREAEALYNLSVARGESYDFQGQARAIAQARAVSETSVDAWSSRLTLSRVVPAAYSVGHARERIERWNAQAKSRRLPGRLPERGLLRALRSPSTLGPLAALLLALCGAWWRGRRGVAGECVRCGRPFCARCKRYGDPALFCTPCVRLEIRREEPGIEAHVEQTRETHRRIAGRDRACRTLSLILPGAHAYFSEHPAKGFAALLAFFFALAAAAIGWRFFEIRPLAPGLPWRPLTMVAAAAALTLWLGGNAVAWRKSHGA